MYISHTRFEIRSCGQRWITSTISSWDRKVFDNVFVDQAHPQCARLSIGCSRVYEMRPSRSAAREVDDLLHSVLLHPLQ